MRVSALLCGTFTLWPIIPFFAPGASCGDELPGPAPNDSVDIDALSPSTGVYEYDGNKIILVSPRDAVNRVVYSGNVLWTRKPSEKFVYCKVYLRDDQPYIAVMTKMDASGSSSLGFIKEEDQWKKCPNYNDKIKALKVHVEYTTPFSLDISGTIDTPQCSIFEVRVLRVPTRLYFPKNGYTATEVRDGSTGIWKATEADEHCISCDLYLENNRPTFIIVTTRGSYGKAHKYYEQNDAQNGPLWSGQDGSLWSDHNGHPDHHSNPFWAPITEGAFIKKHAEMVSKRSSRAESLLSSESDDEQADVQEPRRDTTGWLSLLASKIRAPSSRLMSRIAFSSSGGSYELPFVQITSDDEIVQGAAAKSASSRGARQRRHSGATIDLALEDLTIYTSFLNHYDNIPTRLIVPQRGVNITMIVHGRYIVWVPRGNERFASAKVYLKNDEPGIVMVTTRVPEGLRNTYCKFKNGRWRDSLHRYNEKIMALRVPAEYKADFVIHLEDTMDTPQCTIFETQLHGIDTRFFIPKNGYNVVEVRHGSASIWTSSGDDEHCISCNLYFENKRPCLLSLGSSGFPNRRYRYYAKVEGEWKRVEDDEFYAKKRQLSEW